MNYEQEIIALREKNAVLESRLQEQQKKIENTNTYIMEWTTDMENTIRNEVLSKL